jgi:hypothetical protein
MLRYKLYLRCDVPDTAQRALPSPVFGTCSGPRDRGSVPSASMSRSRSARVYIDVSSDQEQEFIFPTGRWWAQELGYPEPALSRVPDATVESYAGVANHWTLGVVEPGSVVLDLGCGAGTDLLIAAQMTGQTSRDRR